MSNGNERFASRKWILTKWGLVMYTAVHLINAAAVLWAANKTLLPKSAVEELWTGSLTVWSVGVAALIAIYMTGNVASTVANRFNEGSQ